MSLAATLAIEATTALSSLVVPDVGAPGKTVARLRIGKGVYGSDLVIHVCDDARLDAAAWLDALADECTELAAKVRDLRPTERAA